jgi:hypothetical protein
MPGLESKSEIKATNLTNLKQPDNLNLIKENNELKNKLNIYESNYNLLMDKFNTLLNSNILSMNNTDS